MHIFPTCSHTHTLTCVSMSILSGRGGGANAPGVKAGDPAGDGFGASVWHPVCAVSTVSVAVSAVVVVALGSRTSMLSTVMGEPPWERWGEL